LIEIAGIGSFGDVVRIDEVLFIEKKFRVKIDNYSLLLI